MLVHVKPGSGQVPRPFGPCYSPLWQRSNPACLIAQVKPSFGGTPETGWTLLFGRTYAMLEAGQVSALPRPTVIYSALLVTASKHHLTTSPQS